MYRKTIGALAVFLVVSIPTLLADPIYNFDPDQHFIFSSTRSIATHPHHDSLLSEESFFSSGPSSFSLDRKEHLFDADLLADKPNSGLHLGWEKDVEHSGLHLGWEEDVEHNHHHHHHYNGGPTNGNIDPPNDPVTGPEPSTTVSLISGLAMVLFFNSRKRASA